MTVESLYFLFGGFLAAAIVAIGYRWTAQREREIGAAEALAAAPKQRRQRRPAIERLQAELIRKSTTPDRRTEIRELLKDMGYSGTTELEKMAKQMELFEKLGGSRMERLAERALEAIAPSAIGAVGQVMAAKAAASAQPSSSTSSRVVDQSQPQLPEPSRAAAPPAAAAEPEAPAEPEPVSAGSPPLTAPITLHSRALIGKLAARTPTQAAGGLLELGSPTPDGRNLVRQLVGTPDDALPILLAEMAEKVPHFADAVRWLEPQMGWLLLAVQALRARAPQWAWAPLELPAGEPASGRDGEPAPAEESG